jgi:hypothetical protein
MPGIFGSASSRLIAGLGAVDLATARRAVGALFSFAGRDRGGGSRTGGLSAADSIVSGFFRRGIFTASPDVFDWASI